MATAPRKMAPTKRSARNLPCCAPARNEACLDVKGVVFSCAIERLGGGRAVLGRRLGDGSGVAEPKSRLIRVR